SGAIAYGPGASSAVESSSSPLPGVRRAEITGALGSTSTAELGSACWTADPGASPQPNIPTKLRNVTTFTRSDLKAASGVASDEPARLSQSFRCRAAKRVADRLERARAGATIVAGACA